jgi:hypothetical protein
MTLSPYQYQLGDIKFGRDTQIPIQKVDIQTYNVNNQDFQVQRSDENRFGVDTLAPSPIVFTMSVLNNYELDSMAGMSAAPFPDDLFANNNNLLSQLAAEWKNPSLRMTWGATVPLLFCDKSGDVRRIYGRPGKFAHAPRNKAGENWIDVQAEFRRADTYAHSDLEYLVGHPTDLTRGLPPDGTTAVTASRLGGDGDSWLRFLIYGPMTHAVIQYGSYTLELASTIASATLLEVSSYPWARRVVDSLGVNHRTEVVGSTLYLDQIKFPADSSMNIHWTCTGGDTTTQLYMLWREAYNVI